MTYRGDINPGNRERIEWHPVVEKWLNSYGFTTSHEPYVHASGLPDFVAYNSKRILIVECKIGTSWTVHEQLNRYTWGFITMRRNSKLLKVYRTNCQRINEKRTYSTYQLESTDQRPIHPILITSFVDEDYPLEGGLPVVYLETLAARMPNLDNYYGWFDSKGWVKKGTGEIYDNR
jgi:hypothetical protein